MCEANAYMVENEEQKLIMESVDTIDPAGENTWRLVGIFGDQAVVKGRIRNMRLVDHTILFEPVEA
jgi:predicted RNA-binding protein